MPASSLECAATMKTLYKLDLLVAIYIFCVATSELMGAKTFPLVTIGTWTLNQSVSIFTVPLVFTINDMITEVYGKERTRSIIRAGLVIVALIMLFSLLCTNLPASSRFAANEAAYDTIFGLSARFSFASLLAFTLSEFTDVYVFAKLRQKFGTSKLWLRNNVSNFIAQFLDTAIFMFAAFWAFDQTAGSNFSFILSLMIPYWIVKCLMSIIETPFVYLGVKWLKSDQAANV